MRHLTTAEQRAQQIESRPRRRRRGQGDNLIDKQLEEQAENR